MCVVRTNCVRCNEAKMLFGQTHNFSNSTTVCEVFSKRFNCMKDFENIDYKFNQWRGHQILCLKWANGFSFRFDALINRNWIDSLWCFVYAKSFRNAFFGLTMGFLVCQLKMRFDYRIVYYLNVSRFRHFLVQSTKMRNNHATNQHNGSVKSLSVGAHVCLQINSFSMDSIQMWCENEPHHDCVFSAQWMWFLFIFFKRKTGNSQF